MKSKSAGSVAPSMRDTDKAGSSAGHLESDSGSSPRSNLDGSQHHTLSQPSRTSPGPAETPGHQLPLNLSQADTPHQNAGPAPGEYTASEGSISQYPIEDTMSPSQLDMSERLHPLGEECPESADVVESRSASSCSTHNSVVSARHEHLMQYLQAQSSGGLSSGSDLKETLSSERQETTAIWQHKSTVKSDAHSSSETSSGVWYALTSVHESSSDTRPSSDLPSFQGINAMLSSSSHSEFLPMQSWHSVEDLSTLHVTKTRGSGGPASLPTYPALIEEQRKVEGTPSTMTNDVTQPPPDSSSPGLKSSRVSSATDATASLTQIPLEDTPMHTDLTNGMSRYRPGQPDSLTQFPIEDSSAHSFPSSTESSIARLRAEPTLSPPGDHQAESDHHFSAHSDSLAWDQSIKFQPEVTRLTLGESYLHMEKRPLGSSTPSARPSDRFPADLAVNPPSDEDVTPKAEQSSSDHTDTTDSVRPTEQTARSFVLYPPELQSSGSDIQDPSSSSRTSAMPSPMQAGLQEEIRDSIERLSFLRTREASEQKETEHSKVEETPKPAVSSDMRASQDSDLMRADPEAVSDNQHAEPPGHGTDSQLERKRLALAGFSLETISVSQDSAYSTRLSTRHTDSELQQLSDSGSERQRLNSASTYRSLSDIPDRVGSEWDITESLELRAPSMDSINNMQLQLEISTPEPDSQQEELNKRRAEKNRSLIPQPANLSPTFSRRQYPPTRTPGQLSVSTSLTTSWSLDTEDRNELRAAGDSSSLERVVLSASSDTGVGIPAISCDEVTFKQSLEKQMREQGDNSETDPIDEKLPTLPDDDLSSNKDDILSEADHSSVPAVPSLAARMAAADNQDLELLVAPGDLDSTGSSRSALIHGQGDPLTSSSASNMGQLEALDSTSSHTELRGAGTRDTTSTATTTNTTSTTTTTSSSVVTSPKHHPEVRPLSVASSANTEDTLDRDVRSILRKYGESLSDEEDVVHSRGPPEGLAEESESGSSTLKFGSHDSNWYVEKYMATDASTLPRDSKSTTPQPPTTSTPQPPPCDSPPQTTLAGMPLVPEDAALDAEVAHLSEHSDNEERPLATADVRSNVSSTGSTVNTDLIAQQLSKPTLPLTYVSNNESDTDTEFRTTSQGQGQEDSELNTSQLSQFTISSLGTLEDVPTAVQDRHKKSEVKTEALKPVAEVPERLEAKDISKVSEDLAQRVRQLLTSLSDDASSGESRSSSRRSSQCGSINYEQLQAELDCIQQGLAVLQSGELALGNSQGPPRPGPNSSLPVPGAGDSTMVSSTASIRLTDGDRMSESDVEVGTPRLYAWDYAADLGVDSQSDGFLARKQIRPPIEDSKSELSGMTSLRPDSAASHSQHSGRNSSELLHSSMRSDSGSHSDDRTLHVSNQEPTESSSGERTLKPHTPALHRRSPYTSSSSEQLIGRSRSSGSSGLSGIERLHSPVIAPKDFHPRDSLEDSYTRYGAYYTQRFAAADRERLYGIPAVSSSSSGSLDPKHSYDRLARRTSPSIHHDFTYAQQVEQLMARDSPSKQAYSYLSEAERSRQSLDSRHSTPNSSLNASTGTPLPRAPLAAFHNIRSFLASQVDQRSKADFDASVELHSPYRRHMEANLGPSYDKALPGDRLTAARFHTPERRSVSPVRRRSTDKEVAAQDATSTTRDSYRSASRAEDSYQSKSDLAASLPSRPHSEPSPSHMRHSGSSSIYPHRRRYGADFASPSLEPVSSSSVIASRTSPHNSTPLAAAPQTEPSRLQKTPTVASRDSGEVKSKQTSPSTSDSPSSSPLSNASLRPYRPPGSSEVYYVADDGTETDDGNASTTTMESTHIGSDDANGPNLPANCYGSRQEPPKDTVGIYGNKKQVEARLQPADHLTPIREQASFVEESAHPDLGQSSRSTERRGYSGKVTPVEPGHHVQSPDVRGSPHLATASSRSSTPGQLSQQDDIPSSLEATVDGYCTPRESSHVLKERKPDLSASLPTGKLYDLRGYEQPLDLSRFAASSKKALQEPLDLSHPSRSTGHRNMSDAHAGEAQKIINKYINPTADVSDDARDLVTMDTEEELKAVHLMSRQLSDIRAETGMGGCDDLEDSARTTPSQDAITAEKLSPLLRRAAAELSDMPDDYRNSEKMEFAPMAPDLDGDNSFMSPLPHKSPSAPALLEPHATIITAAALHSSTLSPALSRHSPAPSRHSPAPGRHSPAPGRHSPHQDLANTSIGDPRRARSPYDSSMSTVSDQRSSYEERHRRNSPLRMDIPLNSRQEAERDLDHVSRSSLRTRTPDPHDRTSLSGYSRASERSAGKSVSWDMHSPQDNTSYEEVRAEIRRDMNLLWQRFQRTQQQELDNGNGQGGPELSHLLRNPVQHLVNTSKSSEDQRSIRREAAGSRTSAAYEDSMDVNSSGSYIAFEIPMDDSDASSTKTYTVDEDEEDYPDSSAQRSKPGHSSQGSQRQRSAVTAERVQEVEDTRRRKLDKPRQEYSGKRLRPSGESQPSTSGLKSLLAEETLQSIPEDSTLDSISTDYTTTSESDITPRIAKRHLPSDPKLLKLQQKVHRQKEKFLMDRRKELKLRARIHMLERLLNERALVALGHDVSHDTTTSTQSSLDTNDDTVIEKIGDMTDPNLTVISDVTSTCSHMSDGTCTPPNFHRCDCGHKHKLGESGDAPRSTKTEASKVKKAAPPLNLSEKNYAEPKAAKKPGRSSQASKETRQKSTSHSPTRQRQSTPAPRDSEMDGRPSRGKSPHRRSPVRERKEARDAKHSRSPHRHRQHSAGHKQKSSAQQRSDKKENSPVVENRRQMKERRSMQIQTESQSRSRSPKRRAHSVGSSGEDVAMVSEGVQTSFSQRSTASSRTDKKTKMPTPQSQGNQLTGQKADKNPKTLAAQCGVSWFIPFKEPKPWRPPLRERQQFTTTHSRFDVPQPYDRRSVEPMYPPQVYVANYVTEANYDESAEKRFDLQEACEMFMPKFVSRSRERQKCIALRSEERKIQELHQHERELLFGHSGVVMPRPLYDDPLTEQLFRPKRRFMSRIEQKELTLKKYKGLPEVIEKEKLKKREAEYQTNRLRAKLYKQRILNQVLKKRRNAAWN